MKKVLHSIQFHYEVVVAPLLGTHFRFLLLPLFFLCKRLRLCFVVNIVSSLGHITVELDHFFRMHHLKEIDPTRRYIWLKKGDPYAKTCVQLYRKKFWWASSKTWIYNLFLPLTMAFPEIVCDAGISRLKWQLPKIRKYREFTDGTYLHQVSKKEGLLQTIRYFQRASKSSEFFPLADLPPHAARFGQLFPNGTEKLALIQMKDVVRNATAKKPDPTTYLPAMEHLKTLGYQLVFVGREKMPPLFHNRGVINYAESPVATFANDLHLFHIAEIILITGCGVSILADTLNKYYLFLNSWHLPVPPFSKRSIFVPTLLERRSGGFLNFGEQSRLYQSLVDVGPEVFPAEEYIAHNATSEEILAATKELLVLKQRGTMPLSPTQEQLRRLDPTAPMYYSQSRCSQFFLDRHAELLIFSLQEKSPHQCCDNG